jgi:hypothetical protein
MHKAPRPTYRQALGIILALGLLLRIVLALIQPPGYDESYYLFYGRHLALSYFDHPLAVGLWAAAGQAITPLFQANPILALRLPCLVSYTLAQGLLSEATRLWFGSRAALLALAITSLSPLLFACGGLLLLPDSPLVLALSLLLWWLARQPLHGRRTPLESLQFGGILGLLTLCKYQSLVVVLTLVVLRLVDSARRRCWAWRDTALILAGWLSISWPLWLWNLRHGWLSFSFHAGRTATSSPYHWDGPLMFLLSQLALLWPLLGLVLLVTLAPARDGNPQAAGLLRSLALPQLALFLLLAGRMQVLASWLVPAWWLLVPLGGAWLARPDRWARLWLRGLAVLTLLAVPGLSLVAAAHVRWGIARGLIPAQGDTSGQLMPPGRLRLALQGNPKIWQALSQAEVIGSNRYELPGFLALALAGRSGASFSCFSDDCRGFDQWRSSLNPRARRGVLFAVIGDYQPIGALSQPGATRSWRVPDLRPLGTVKVQRGGEPVVSLEFYSFDPSRLVHTPPP